MVKKGGKNDGAASPAAFTNMISSSTKSPTTVVTKSPFFRPSDPRKQVSQVTTPGGTKRLKKKSEVDAEHKSSVFGASCNMVVSIIGAGIVGIPYAVKQSGLIAGMIMVILCAIITEKTLRLLVETAKHINVPSYETLFEACFGHVGFFAMSIMMFLMSYGAMVGYMMIIKDSLSFLLGIDADDAPMRRAVLAVATLAVLFPISAQRDMADLAKTSKVSVTFYVLMVLFVVCFSPVGKSVEANGGWKKTVSESVIKPETFFTGLGVLSFAYVCQHSAYIIAGSLDRPTKKRWAAVTGSSLLFCGLLASLMGFTGYLGFLDKTDGNILNNFEAMNLDGEITPAGRLANASRALLCVCMFFVYPMDAFVSRHVLMVLMFKGRRAHEGDDHSVLARTDRRILLTMGMITITVLPAILLDDLGSVLAVTGAVAASFLSYIGPGSSYLAVHGDEFMKLLREKWTWGNPYREPGTASTPDGTPATTNPVLNAIGRLAWYLALMPLWVCIAQIGQKNLEQHYAKEALKSPIPSRLGKVVRPKVPSREHVLPPGAAGVVRKTPPRPNVTDENDDEEGALLPPPRTNSMPSFLDAETKKAAQAGTASTAPPGHETSAGYGSIAPVAAGAAAAGGGNRAIGAAIAKKNAAADEEEAELDPQFSFPKLWDFLVAIFFVAFGIVAMVVGLWSIFGRETNEDVVDAHEVKFKNATKLANVTTHPLSGAGSS